ncbi:MAG TPA: molecular chaperone HtpG [Lentisphaeria bacterium]|nr:MAG: molecular chaperone HtpG [Lentisphaerae bacterium GWF2_50_93]HCE43618.1 molecular chaperone HtpG [Lentisphaeria bacterium]
MPEETKKFQTEVQELLNLVIHSLYSNKDIFLRELIANAADAIDKVRFESLTSPSLKAEWQIKIEPDKTRNTLRISDNGVGMTRSEVVENIGTIAKSGTREYLAALKKSDSKNLPELIGQFGVGFYSAFMVSDKIELVSKKAGSDEKATLWISQGESSYTIDDAEMVEHGTSITLHLKPDCKIYLEDWKIQEIVKKYSDFIEHPVKLVSMKKQKDESSALEEEIINSQKAIWLRPANEISDEEYKQFYGHLSHFDTDPLLHIHYSAEGTSEFKALLFIPSKAPFDFLNPEQRKAGLHLYIKRVFITESCPDLLPEYLRFIKGVVDSSDLPLNISREMLQDNPGIHKINKNLVRKIISELKNLIEKDREKYNSFFTDFGRFIKEGVHSDFQNKDKLIELLLFETLNNADGKLFSLKEYSEKMPAEQKEIYYICGESRAVLEKSPHLEFLRSRNFDVILMTDPIDEWILQSIPEYSGKKLKSAGKGDFELDEKTKSEKEDKTKKAVEEHKTLVEFLKKTLEKDVREVKFSTRLTESPCCLVSGEHDPSIQMEKMFKAMNREMPKMKRILELNPDHPLVASLQSLYDKNSSDPKLAEFAEMLYDQALLTEGIPLADPIKFSKRVATLMVDGIKGEIGK